MHSFKTSCWLVLLAATIGTGCRFDDRDPLAITQERLLIDGSWNTFSEVYSPGRGYAIGFLAVGLVVRESGRMSGSWSIKQPYFLEFTDGRSRPRRYRWFEPHNLLAYCLAGFGKPFFIAPDSVEYSAVLVAAKEAGVYDCDAAAVLSIAGATIVRLEDSLRTPISVDIRGLELDWQLRSAIGKLPGVARLNLSGVTLRDVDLAHVSTLHNLKELDLSNTDIGDDGLVHLAGLDSLRRLVVTGTRVTSEGIRDLQDELPGLAVQSSPDA